MTFNERQQKNKLVESYTNFIYKIRRYNFKVKRPHRGQDPFKQNKKLYVTYKFQWSN